MARISHHVTDQATHPCISEQPPEGFEVRGCAYDFSGSLLHVTLERPRLLALGLEDAFGHSVAALRGEFAPREVEVTACDQHHREFRLGSWQRRSPPLGPEPQGAWS